jgi:integrase
VFILIFRLQKEAEEEYNRVKYEIQQGIYVEPSKLLFSDYFKEWLTNKHHSISPQTAEMYAAHGKNHILPSLGNIPFSKLTALHIQRFITQLINKGLSNSTVDRIYSIVNSCLNNAVKKDLIHKNVAAQVDKPKVTHKEMKVWDEQEVRKFLKIARNEESRLYIAFHLALLTGMRQGEILGLRWYDVDFDNSNVIVRQTLSHNGKTLKSGGKSKNSVRSIAIDGTTLNELKKHQRFINQEKMQLGEQYEDNDLVVCTSKGTLMSPRNLNRTWYRLLDKSELPKIRFHDLRHSHASLLMKLDQHPKIVQERLGHSSIRITLDTYSHIMPNMQHDAAQKLGSMIL